MTEKAVRDRIWLLDKPSHAITAFTAGVDGVDHRRCFQFTDALDRLGLMNIFM